MSNMNLAGSYVQVIDHMDSRLAELDLSYGLSRPASRKLGVILDLEDDNDFTIEKENAEDDQFPFDDKNVQAENSGFVVTKPILNILSMALTPSWRKVVRKK